MNIKKSLWVVFAAVSVCSAQTYNISGIVTDTGTTPISGAVVKLEKAGLTATSGADGRFTLTNTGVFGESGGLVVQQPAVTFRNGFIRFDLREPAVVRVDIYSVQGRLLSTIQQTIGAGRQSMAIPQVGAGVCIYRVKIGGKETFDVKRVMLDGKQGTLRQAQRSAENRGMERQAKAAVAINDVIEVKKDGYLNYRCVQFNGDTAGVQIKMIANAGNLTDIDDNVYQTVKIGNQVWTVENLKTTKYNDGTAITFVSDSAAWYNLYITDSTTGAYCYYGNNSANKEKYGALYTWYAVSTDKLAPEGWRVPTLADWDTLENYLIANGYNDDTATGDNIAKSMAAKTDWQSQAITGVIGNDLCKNNASGFSALPGGFRDYDGNFNAQSYYGFWWSATKGNASDAYYRNLYFDASYLSRYYIFKSCGFSVRLLRDLKGNS